MISHKKDEASQLYERSNSFDRGSTGYRVTAKDMNIKNLIKTIPLTGNKRLGRNTPAPYSVGYGFCSFRRNVFQKVGLFDEKLGRGTPAIGSEDVDIFYRILKAGYSIDYEPDAIVRHEHRATLDAVLYDAYSSGVSVRAFTRKYMARDPYIFCLFIGNFFLLSFSLTKNIFTRDHALRQMITQELKGFLVGKDKKH
jgi:GT2 family glycosyltransferase